MRTFTAVRLPKRARRMANHAPIFRSISRETALTAAAQHLPARCALPRARQQSLLCTTVAARSMAAHAKFCQQRRDDARAGTAPAPAARSSFQRPCLLQLAQPPTPGAAAAASEPDAAILDLQRARHNHGCPRAASLRPQRADERSQAAPRPRRPRRPRAPPTWQHPRAHERAGRLLTL